ncbi:TolB amino-terminal domain-containing protein [Parasphingorhabdus marina DSM 22363]|uniref:TolB amino-terminal domain-containing protein n=1 Tax=Parasphingorhabdus marina DSM 22363 TaxID=1123272 RepID=A0A1N6HU44_9SPHN|nr:winged helix-turn-helix domain-containing protein [Parasphingorhabdus marina]SIO23312.1 TolB amino-terminal domain-containing protein [Parasphingorhabdus marina DSM 22363]
MLIQANHHFHPVYRFEGFELDLRLQELRRNGAPVHVEPQVFALLALLIANGDRMISKQELLDHVWDGRTVSDSAVNSRIRSARTILGDDGKAQRLIRTVHNRGFRFAGKLSEDVPLTDRPSTRLPEHIGGRRQVSSLRPAVPAAARETALTIAVKPFQSCADNADQNKFADGIEESIIVALAKLRRLRTIVWNAEPAAEKCQGLSVANDTIPCFHYLLEGTIQYSGNRMRLTARLIDGATGQHVWADRYSRQKSDIFALQDELTRQIVSALQYHVAFGEQSKMWATGTENFTAWEALIRARELCLTHRRKLVLEGRELAQRALSIDPGYTAASHWLAYSFWAEAQYGGGSRREILLQEARVAIHTGLETEPSDANLLSLLALVHTSAGDYDRALSLACRAMALGPGNAHVFSNAGLVFLYCDRPEDSVMALRKSMEFAPLHCAGTSAILVMALWLCDETDAALAEANYGLQIAPDYFAIHSTMAAILADRGQIAEAGAVADELLGINPHFTISGYAASQSYKNPETLEHIVAAMEKSGLPLRPGTRGRWTI